MVSGVWFQTFTAIAASFGSASMGLLNVWPSYTQYLYTANDTVYLAKPMTDSEVALLGSLPSLGGMIGTAVTGVLIDKFGRRLGGLSITIPFVLSWAIIYVSSSSLLILAARLLGGIAGGAYLIYGPVFISEVADDSIRGLLATFPNLFYGIGVFFSYLLGWYSTYSVTIWINLLVAVICCLLVMSVKESPIFLLRQNREEDTTNAIAHYKGSSPSSTVVLKELSKLKLRLTPIVELISINEDSLSKTEEAEKEKLNSDSVIPEIQQKQSSWRSLFASPSSRRAFFTLLTIITLQVFMGLVPVQVFAKKVFNEADPSKADLFSVIFALMLIFGCFVTAFISDKAGRRVLVINSSGLVAISMVMLGVQTQKSLGAPWVTVVIILLYCFFFMCGAGTVPYVLMSEIFTPEVQNIASLLIGEWVWFLNFAIIAIFPYITSCLGMHGAFYIFAGFALINAVVSYIIVPETKGLSNVDIQEAFSRRK
ncbi:solute carrier family 2, facilitated glucose transporter member 8-like [Galleria mellonella]|uniref:Solute carrier family 2, facilitated glucose transporter member 8-like n=1 Tax=Galleria mellonella TaxID=7137 RepID=A0A6J1WAY5_GALME|nr:solute carrier family 2, facilitated glucose transporter member 8-like [Galleria mellonella]